LDSRALRLRGATLSGRIACCGSNAIFSCVFVVICSTRYRDSFTLEGIELTTSGIDDASVFADVEQ
jgi:hypothetical protein